MRQPAASHYVAPADSPAWFIENLRHPGEPGTVNVNQRRVNCLNWNWERHDMPVLLLVHGFSGHVNWWSFLAPFFTDRYRVLALDLPGMGDSEAPVEYTDDCFSDAIVGVIDHYGLQDVTIVGHSFGGAQTIRALAKRPQVFRHGIVVDSYITLPPEEPVRVIEPKGLRRYRDSQQSCIEHFRLSPPQPLQIEAIRQYIGFHSCSRDDQGWHWKFDPMVCNKGEIHGRELFRSITAPVDCIYGELSMFNTNDKPQLILESFPNAGELVIIPGAYHHLMVDHPLELVAAINRLLG